MAKEVKQVKRTVKVLDLEDLSGNPNGRKYYAVFEGNETYMPTRSLPTEYKMYLPDWERLGKPSKIRVTVTVVDN